MSLQAIKSAIPHREPFLLVDEIVEQTENRIVCRKPGVLLCEAAMQAGAVLLAKEIEAKSNCVPVVSRMNNVKFKQMVRPGDTVTFDVELTEKMAGAFFLTAKATVGDKTAVTFDFACKVVPRP
jgi:3-hydroxyacyl-[acyl-carrier-protein] dehydratase